MFEFTISNQCTDTHARVGSFRTPHGDIQTPCFIPVGTSATVKTLTPKQLSELDTQIVLANTYHLFLQPGHELIKEAGGLHKWMNWDKPIITDSGGYQVFSLAKKRKILENGVEFQSNEDGGKTHLLTPQSVMEIQAALGSDIIMVLDECTEADVSKEYAREALKRTHRWAVECKDAQLNPKTQALFPIVQGALYKDLRVESAKFLSDLNLPGIAVGGLSVGEAKIDMYKTLDVIIEHLPNEKPHYLMGVGTPEDLIEAVARGMDMFDCVLPTRLARTGSAFTAKGRINLNNAQYRTTHEPIDTACSCYSCQSFTLSYLHHLVKQNEILGMVLLTMHNVNFLLRLMEEMREKITEGTFLTWSKGFLGMFKPMGS